VAATLNSPGEISDGIPTFILVWIKKLKRQITKFIEEIQRELQQIYDVFSLWNQRLRTRQKG
jgi:hypothetical protein